MKINKTNSLPNPGVKFEADRNRWRVDISFKGKRMFLGRYVDFNEALAKRIEAERNIWNAI
jgi:hypothetical protein